jgi:hypothetical protein
VSVFHASWGTLAIWVLSRLEWIAGDALHASVVNGSDFFPRSIKIFVTASRIGNRLPETHGVLKCSVELDSIFFNRRNCFGKSEQQSDYNSSALQLNCMMLNKYRV